MPYDMCLTVVRRWQPQQRFFDLPLRFPVADKYKDMGTVVLGKLEAGTIRTGEQLVVLPNKSTIVVSPLSDSARFEYVCQSLFGLLLKH